MCIRDRIRRVLEHLQSRVRVVSRQIDIREESSSHVDDSDAELKHHLAITNTQHHEFHFSPLLTNLDCFQDENVSASQSLAPVINWLDAY
eukprot:1148362-Prorocentrum_lima.AAC.1